jgi:hypothetical protein
MAAFTLAAAIFFHANWGDQDPSTSSRTSQLLEASFQSRRSVLVGLASTHGMRRARLRVDSGISDLTPVLRSAIGDAVSRICRLVAMVRPPHTHSTPRR